MACRVQCVHHAMASRHGTHRTADWLIHRETNIALNFIRHVIFNPMIAFVSIECTHGIFIHKSIIEIRNNDKAI